MCVADRAALFEIVPLVFERILNVANQTARVELQQVWHPLMVGPRRVDGFFDPHSVIGYARTTWTMVLMIGGPPGVPVKSYRRAPNFELSVFPKGTVEETCGRS